MALINPSNFPYFALTIGRRNTIKLILANHETTAIVLQAVGQHVQILNETRQKNGVYRIQLVGAHFDESCCADFKSMQMCCKLFTDLRGAGWRLALSSDLSRTKARSTLFFRKQQSTPDAATTSVSSPEPLTVCLSLIGVNKVALINARDVLQQTLSTAVRQAYDLGSSATRRYDDSTLELTLNYCPWNSWKTDQNTCGANLILNIFRAFDEQGFGYYGTANLNGATDSVFFTNRDRQQLSRRYMLIGLNAKDRLRLKECPENVVQATRNLVKKHWNAGIRDEQVLFDQTFEFELNGNPWWTNLPSEIVQSRRLITALLKELATLGWGIVTGLKISEHIENKSVFVFETCQPTSLSYFCISMNHNNRLRLIDAPNDVREAIRETISKVWPRGAKFERNYHGVQGIRLFGSPWEASGLAGSVAGRFTSLMMNEMNDRCWQVICSADVSSTYSNIKRKRDERPERQDVHSWFVASYEITDLEMRRRNSFPLESAHGTFAQSWMNEELPLYNSPPPSYEDLFGPDNTM